MYKFVLFFCNEFLFVLIFLIVLRNAGCVIPPRCFVGKTMFVEAARGARRFFELFRASILASERARRRKDLHFRKKIGRVSRRSVPHARGIRMCQKAAPVAHSLSCLRFFGRSSHIPRLFLLLVSVPSRLVFSEICSPCYILHLTLRIAPSPDKVS